LDRFIVPGLQNASTGSLIVIFRAVSSPPVHKTPSHTDHSSPNGNIINGPWSLVWTLDHLSIKDASLLKSSITFLLFDWILHLILSTFF